jgi:AcrR family transcriptional regulator
MSTTQRSEESLASRDPDGRRSDIAQEILAAANRLVADKGESFTTHEVTREAGVALQTFYRYYPGKDQLLLAVIQNMISEHCRMLEESARSLEDPIDRLRLYVNVTLESLDSDLDPSAPRFMTSQHWRLLQVDPDGMNAATKPFSDLVQRELDAAREAGSLAPRDPARDAWLITKLVIAVFHHYAFVPEDAGVATAGEDVWQFCLAAVQGPAAATAPRRKGLARLRR